MKRASERITIGQRQFTARLIGDVDDRLANGKVRLVRPIWNGMLRELAAQGLEPEVQDGKIYIRLFTCKSERRRAICKSMSKHKRS